MYNVMVVDDEVNILKLMDIWLTRAGFGVITATNGEEALAKLKKEEVDLIVADVMMPKMDGFTLVETLRAEGNSIPVILATAKESIDDKKSGFNCGADDYMVKPFNPLELIARINANLRRFYKFGNAQDEDTGKITIGELTLDTNTLPLEKRGVPVNLTATEYKILLMLMKSPGRVFTKMQIYEEVNGDYYANDDNTMMVHISNIRDKIEDDPKNPRYIKTLRGLGYKIERQ